MRTGNIMEVNLYGNSRVSSTLMMAAKPLAAPIHMFWKSLPWHVAKALEPLAEIDKGAAIELRGQMWSKHFHEPCCQFGAVNRHLMALMSAAGFLPQDLLFAACSDKRGREALRIKIRQKGRTTGLVQNF
mmetsp:Transcript_9982/g.22305  ORF Transcript_9982/g.22305 Transcript_9982/m.22305 type:complete len:130 (+) Transcript_9982:260-649(+)